MPTTNNKGGLDTTRAAGWSDANPHGTVALRPPERLGWPWRRLRLPHFLGLGTQKGGTTSLQKLLEQHPGVYLPTCKEIHYFSQHAEEPARWYAEHYRDARLGQRRGDITRFICSILTCPPASGRAPRPDDRASPRSGGKGPLAGVPRPPTWL